MTLEFVDLQPFPLQTIADNDRKHSIRVVNLPTEILDQIWTMLSAREQTSEKMKRYFRYKLDQPPLQLVLRKLPQCEGQIHLIKGHGSSPAVKIPRVLDEDLGYILGAIRDGGIHYDKKSQAYKVHFAQKDKTYLETEIVPRLDRLFGIQPGITRRKDGVHQIQVASKPLYLFFSTICNMKEVQQYWETPNPLRGAPRNVLKAYIRGFHDAEGSSDHIFHSWYREGECEPLQFISTVLNTTFGIKTSPPLKHKMSGEFDRFPAYQLYINDYQGFKREILET